MPSDATRRFSHTVDSYIKYRPGYPPAVRDLLVCACGLHPGEVVADIGSGTGLLATLFLHGGHRVFGVEPNQAMREAGQRLLRQWDTFTSVNGSAEDTGLDDRSVDLVTAGQAFHWFDRRRARREFLRVLTRGGHTVRGARGQRRGGHALPNGGLRGSPVGPVKATSIRRRAM